jgi:DNA-binding CsgD family transcriptional regulator
MNEESPKVLNYNNLSNKEITKEVLENLINFNLSSSQIARQLKCNPVYIKRLLKKFKLFKAKIKPIKVKKEKVNKVKIKVAKVKVLKAEPVKNQRVKKVKKPKKDGRNDPRKHNITKEKLISYVEKGFSSFKIAKEIGVSQPTVRYWLTKFDLRTIRLTGRNCLPDGLISKSEEENICYKCPKCKEIKEINGDNFYLNKDNKVYHWCRKCNSADTLKRGGTLKPKCVEYKGGKCIICNYNKCQGALEFHHLDPSIKDYNISRLWSYSWEIVEKELDKCVLLCANCHRELHAGLIKLE